jgi:N-acetylglucosaminyl-diphospho-decaprenol L-rhamnosyltransferase
MTTRLAVIVAVPNYNMGRHLRTLLPALLEHNYDAVCVLDDASTDDSVEIVHSFGGDVALVRGAENRGAAANRNRILEYLRTPAIIHFVDADMAVTTPGAPAIAQELMARYAGRQVGAVGGLVCRPNGAQDPFNYGPPASLRSQLEYAAPILVDKAQSVPGAARIVQTIGLVARRGWPDILSPPRPCSTFWLHEGNMLIYSDLFRSVGGYDAVMRHHEALALALKLDKALAKRQFDPAIRTVHYGTDVRGRVRGSEKRDARRHLNRTYQ